MSKKSRIATSVARTVLRIQRVDNSRDDIREVLRGLHDDVFGDTAPLPNFKEGMWWLVLGPFGQFIGFAGMEPSGSWKNYGYLNRSGVLPSWRGKGLQKRLIVTREKAARKLGWRGTKSDTTGNTYSANNLAALGYKTYRPHVEYSKLKGTIYWKKEF